MEREVFDPGQMATQKCTSQSLLYKELSYNIVGAAMRVHSAMGPGFPENVYQSAFEIELIRSEFEVDRERTYPVYYERSVVGEFRVDLVVNNVIICELKAVESLSTIHEAQLLSYLKASKLRLGLLINFGKDRLEHKRLVN